MNNSAMLSSSDIERLIVEKRHEIETEKVQLGLTVKEQQCESNKENENSTSNSEKPRKQVKFSANRVLCERNVSSEDQRQPETHKEFENYIPPGLERYIRRYIGLPVMLKAGEYSPNNPLVRGERTVGDALLGLGEYERRRNTLRKIRQQQYREYLDQQAKKKQEAKEQAERERREREQREREREEREKELLQKRVSYSPERRRSVQQEQYTPTLHTSRDFHHQYVQPINTSTFASKVDTGVQVDGFSQPLSVAVQTDEAELFRLPPSPSKCQVTEAERELSPRSVHGWPSQHVHVAHDRHERRRSYGDFDERTCLLKKCNSDKVTKQFRHSYMPSIFDGEAIRLRNMQAEKEAAERRQYYQQELKNQIMEQQRIKEERKTREKMLEQAEMRRLEEQLRMLRMAQDREVTKQYDITAAINENTKEYMCKRTELQRELDMDEQKLRRVCSQPTRNIPKRNNNTSKSDNAPSKLPFYYSGNYERSNEINREPYSMNISDNSLFSPNYDVDSYLRKNLNFKKNKETDRFYKEDSESFGGEMKENRNVKKLRKPKENHEKAPLREKVCDIVEEEDRPTEVIEKEPSKKIIEDIDTLPIPVLRHSPKIQNAPVDKSNMSEAMKKVDDKWQVPAVQKNILKAMPNEEGKNVSILTQLGSIRRQLQLEQLRLDRMLSKDDGE